MAYGKKYQIDFDSVPGNEYHLEIHKKDYVGAVLNRIGADVPVLHKWNTDDPKAPIKGSVIEVKLVNENGNLPLSDFFSVEDDTFLFKFYHGLNLKFIGYMVQDDCSEEMLDFTHVINLSATDNLGLLKDVALDESVKAYSLITTLSGIEIEGTAPNTLIMAASTATNTQPGDKLVITGGALAGTYNTVSYSITGVFPFIKAHIVMIEPVATVAAYTSTSIAVYRKQVRGRYQLSEIIKLALAPTNLELACNVYSKLKPVSGSTGRWLEDTYIDSATFLKGESFEDCYNVLQTILSRFKATLLQANGVWNIVRWAELRQYSNAIEGFSYTNDMVYNTTITLDDIFNAGIGELTVAETGLTESILRPYKYAKEKFDYKQPANILRNGNFNNVGALLTSYADGANTVYEYEMKDWDVGYEWTTGGGGYIASSAQRLIRVIINSDGEEIERWGVIKDLSGFDDFACAQSFPIEVTVGDKIKYSFDYKTNYHQSGVTRATFRFNIVTTLNPVPRAANNKYLNNSGKWHSVPYTGTDGLLFVHNFPIGESDQWQSASVESEAVPVDGILYIKLSQAVTGGNITIPPGTPTKETHYKNLRFEIIQSISGQGNIIGHTHTDTQPPTINNKQDEEIDVDDSPSNSIAGTFFLSTFTGPLQDRTKTWQRGAITDQYKLGQITTFDELFWRRIQRSKLEGNLYGLLQDTHLSALTLIRYNHFADSNFLPGSLELDYRNDKARLTLWEMYKDTEADSDLSEIYNFKYLYEKK